MSTDLLSMSTAELGAAFRDRTLSPVELVSACLDRIEATDGVVGAFVEVTADAAREQAREAEQAFVAGRDLGPLQGIPVGIKDLVDVTGVPTRAGSPLREDRVADTDAEVTRRLRDAGAVFLGKTRLDQFAYGASTPGTANPWEPENVAGGSSGGSAAAVSARQCPLAVGTDTAGSVRIPSALCGVVGLKPTLGSVPRRGVVSLAWSLDNVGPIGRSVADVAAMFQAMSGRTMSGQAGEAERFPGSDEGFAGLRVGVPSNFFFDDIDPEVDTAVRAAIARLEAGGAELVPVTIPRSELYEAVLNAILLPEAAAYHADDFPARADQYATQLRKGLTIGSTISAVDYVQAHRLRGLIQDEWLAMFEGIDVLATPTVAMPAPPASLRFVEWPSGRSESVNAAHLRLCLPGNLTGFPAVSLPCGLSTAGLPLAVQLLAAPQKDLELLAVAARLEAELDPLGPPTGIES